MTETRERLIQIKQIVAKVRAAPERKAILIEIHSAAVAVGISHEEARNRDYAGTVELRTISDAEWQLFRDELRLRATKMESRAKYAVERRISATLRKIAELFEEEAIASAAGGSGRAMN